MKTNLEPTEIERQFARLAALLPFRLLATEDGGTRLASPDEFMLMYTSDDGSMGAFKHRDTRNYVYVKSACGEDFLSVPTDNQPFHRGFFDVF